jgi:hypothetical protein
MAEILERAMEEFVATTPVGAFDDFLSNNQIISPRVRQQFVYCLTHPKIRVKDRVRTGKVKEQLTVLMPWPTVDGTASFCPTPASVHKLNVVPDLFLIPVLLPFIAKQPVYRGYNIYPIKAANKQTQITPRGQRVVRYSYTTYLYLFLLASITFSLHL